MSRCSSGRKRTLVTATSPRSSLFLFSTMPLITSWVRPDSRRRKVSASAASAGFPNTRPSSTTSVSTPSTSSPSTALALRRAFSRATVRGSPSASSSTSGGTTRNSTPSCSRMARRWGEREASVSSAKLGEEQTHLALGGLGGVRAVHQVGLHLQGVVPADRSRGCLEGVGGADHLTGGHHGLITLEHGGHQRAAGNEVHEICEERLVGVLGVVALGQVALHPHLLESHDPQPLALEAADHLARERTRECVRLDQDQRSLHWLTRRPPRAWPPGTPPLPRGLPGGRRAPAAARRSAAPCGGAAPGPAGRPRPRSTGRSSSAGRGACRTRCRAP